MRHVKLLDGPLAGLVHELQAGWPCPERFGLMDENKVQQWYEVIGDDGKTYEARHIGLKPRTGEENK